MGNTTQHNTKVRANIFFFISHQEKLKWKSVLRSGKFAPNTPHRKTTVEKDRYGVEVREMTALGAAVPECCEVKVK